MQAAERQQMRGSDSAEVPLNYPQLIALAQQQSLRQSGRILVKIERQRCAEPFTQPCEHYLDSTGLTDIFKAVGQLAGEIPAGGHHPAFGHIIHRIYLAQRRKGHLSGYNVTGSQSHGGVSEQQTLLVHRLTVERSHPHRISGSVARFVVDLDYCRFDLIC